MDQLARISEMEERLNRAAGALTRLDAALVELEELRRDVAALSAYYESPLWRADFEADEEGLLPQDLGDDRNSPTFHLYHLQIDPKVVGGDVQELKAKLEEKGVTNIPHFGPIYRFAASVCSGFDEKAIARSCPVTEYVFDKCYTHLPIYGLTKSQLAYMADAILASVSEMKAAKGGRGR